MDEIEIVEQFQKDWSKLEKNKVLMLGITAKGIPNSVMFVSFATEIAGIQVVLGISIGKRHGLTEQLIAIDPTEKIVADRLLLVSNSSSGHYTSLAELRQEIRKGESSAGVCMDELEIVLKRFLENPELFARGIRREAESPSALEGPQSFAVSGGLPSLGKRR